MLNFSQVNATEPLLWEVNIGSGDGLVPSGNKPLPESMLTQTCIAVWRRLEATMSLHIPDTGTNNKFNIDTS